MCKMYKHVQTRIVFNVIVFEPSSQSAQDLPSGLWLGICPLATSSLVWPSVFSTVPSTCGTALTHCTPQSRE